MCVLSQGRDGRRGMACTASLLAAPQPEHRALWPCPGLERAEQQQQSLAHHSCGRWCTRAVAFLCCCGFAHLAPQGS